MRDLVKKALTRTIAVKGSRGSTQQIEVAPSQRLVLGIQFAIVALLCLTGLEIAYMLVIKVFSSEIFAAISLVIGTILGAFFGSKA